MNDFLLIIRISLIGRQFLSNWNSKFIALTLAKVGSIKVGLNIFINCHFSWNYSIHSKFFRTTQYVYIVNMHLLFLLNMLFILNYSRCVCLSLFRFYFLHSLFFHEADMPNKAAARSFWRYLMINCYVIYTYVCTYVCTNKSVYVYQVH